MCGSLPHDVIQGASQKTSQSIIAMWYGSFTVVENEELIRIIQSSAHPISLIQRYAFIVIYLNDGRHTLPVERSRAHQALKECIIITKITLSPRRDGKLPMFHWYSHASRKSGQTEDQSSRLINTLVPSTQAILNHNINS